MGIDFNEALLRLRTGKGAEAFDMESFARGFLMYSICRNNELGNPKSMYVHKEEIGSQTHYKFGPAWDFDAAFDMRKPNADGEFVETPPQGDIIINKMLEYIRECPEFMPIYKNALQKFANEDLPELLNFIKEYAVSIDPSSRMDAYVWPQEYELDWFDRTPAYNVKERADQMSQWLTDRVAYLLEQAEQGLY